MCSVCICCESVAFSLLLLRFIVIFRPHLCLLPFPIPCLCPFFRKPLIPFLSSLTIYSFYYCGLLIYLFILDNIAETYISGGISFFSSLWMCHVASFDHNFWVRNTQHIRLDLSVVFFYIHYFTRMRIYSIKKSAVYCAAKLWKHNRIW